MIVFEITQSEAHQAYQTLQIENNIRQYDFLRSIIVASLSLDRRYLSQQITKALNHQAITCLHHSAGEYRPGEVTVGPHFPPAFVRVPSLMEDFINLVNRNWESTDEVTLATYVLWRLNNIHPFVNGNGRTARAACYFVLCVKAGGLLPGTTILPELIKRERTQYCTYLQIAHDSFNQTGTPNLLPLHALVTLLLQEQLASANPPSSANPSTTAPQSQPAPSNQNTASSEEMPATSASLLSDASPPKVENAATEFSQTSGPSTEH